ncbi:hypothetical protein V1286_004887 [Bradyrhizobium algeriense]|uniref:DUF2905 domain-containing protein n=1 Tax=Bradyrhizobium algeriense TaxID=634784 RepID=A0ABU8BFN8_9BRAD
MATSLESAILTHPSRAADRGHSSTPNPALLSLNRLAHCDRRLGAMSISRLLIIFGLSLVVLGLLWPVISEIGLGRLPGDIVIERDNFRVYIPLATSLLVSVILSLILWLANR